MWFRKVARVSIIQRNLRRLELSFILPFQLEQFSIICIKLFKSVCLVFLLEMGAKMQKKMFSFWSESSNPNKHNLPSMQICTEGKKWEKIRFLERSKPIVNKQI